MTEMDRSRLGADGPVVSQMGLGTMTFGAETDAAEAARQLDLFVDRGGTMIDTADVYAEGRSEEIIGDWAKARGGTDGLVIATKCRFGPPPDHRGASGAVIERCVEASLRRLRMDAIDLFYIHGWDKDVPVAETLGALRDCVQAGKIRHIGWSNLSAWQLQRIVDTAEAQGMPRPVALQPQYNLLERGTEIEVLPCCLENDVSVVPWSPLGGGWLTGKYSAADRPSGATRLGEDPNRGVEAYDLRNTDRTHAVLNVLHEVAERHARPPAHVALAWLAQRPGVASILLGARTTAQLADNLDAMDLRLGPEEVAALTAVSAMGARPYPYNFLQDWCGMDIWQRLGT